MRTNYQACSRTNTRTCLHSPTHLLPTCLSACLPTAEIHRDTIRRVHAARWCVGTRTLVLADGHVTRENVKRQQQLARPPARRPAGRLVPGGRQLPDGKTPALPFLLDRSGPVSRVAQEEPLPVSLLLFSLSLSASFSSSPFLSLLILLSALLRPPRWPRTKDVLYAGDGRHCCCCDRVATTSPPQPHAGAVSCHVVPSRAKSRCPVSPALPSPLIIIISALSRRDRTFTARDTPVDTWPCSRRRRPLVTLVAVVCTTMFSSSSSLSSSSSSSSKNNYTLEGTCIEGHECLCIPAPRLRASAIDY